MLHLLFQFQRMWEEMRERNALCLSAANWLERWRLSDCPSLPPISLHAATAYNKYREANIRNVTFVMGHAHWLQRRRIDSPDFVTTYNQKEFMSIYLCCKAKFIYLSSDKLVTWILLCTLYWPMSSNPIWGLGTSQKPNASSLNNIEVRIEHDSSSSELWMRQICKLLPAYFANWKWRLFSNVHCPCREYSVGWISREKCNFGVSQAAAPTVIQQYAPPIDPKNQYVGDIFQMEAKHSLSKLFLFFSCQSSSIPTLHNVYFVKYIFPRNRTSSNLS